MGFLESIAVVPQIIKVDLFPHQESIKFNHDTELKNIESFEDIGKYGGEGFKINFIEINDEKLATEITRFDLLLNQAMPTRLYR